MPPDRAELDAILDRPDPADATSDTAPEPTPESATDPAPEPAGDPSPEPPAEDPWDAGADTFDRPYVESLRKENQRRRQRSKRYDEVFDGYTDDERDFLLNLAAEVRSNPAQAAQRATQLAQVLAGSEAPGDAPVTPQEAQYLTAGDVQHILNERDNRNAQEAAIGDVYKQAEALGYKQNSRDLIELLWVAANETDNDIGAADKQIKGARQQIIDDYLAQKAKESEDTPDTRTPGGSAPSGEQKIESIKAATAAFKASNLGR